MNDGVFFWPEIAIGCYGPRIRIANANRIAEALKNYLLHHSHNQNTAF